MKRLRKRSYILLASVIAITCSVLAMREEKTEVVATVKYIDETTPTTEPVIEEVYTTQDVYFTSYYQGDGSSGSRTGSGLSVDSFEINDKGWYTYNDQVVIATATYQGLASDYGVLAKYNVAEDEIKYFNYFDELTINVDGVEYPAIVLDTCGASHDIAYLNKHDAGVNRIDIFVNSRKSAVGKVKGHITY